VVKGEILKFKILVYKNGISCYSKKKTLDDFQELDAQLEGKYSKSIKKGIIQKLDFPRREEYDFGQTKSIEALKNKLN